MPKAPTPRSKPSAERPDGGKRPAAGAATDPLAAYRKAAPSGKPASARDPKTSTEAAAREKRERVRWDELVGIPCQVIDSWEDTNDEYGDYVGTVVRLGAGTDAEKDVLVLTSASTRAGKWLTHQHRDGAIDAMAGDGSDGRALDVRAKRSPQHPDGNPMVLLRWAE